MQFPHHFQCFTTIGVKHKRLYIIIVVDSNVHGPIASKTKFQHKQS